MIMRVWLNLNADEYMQWTNGNKVKLMHWKTEFKCKWIYKTHKHLTYTYMFQTYNTFRHWIITTEYTQKEINKGWNQLPILMI